MLAGALTTVFDELVLLEALQRRSVRFLHLAEVFLLALGVEAADLAEMDEAEDLWEQGDLCVMRCVEEDTEDDVPMTIS